MSLIVRFYVYVCTSTEWCMCVCVCFCAPVSTPHAQLQHSNGGGRRALPQLHLQAEGHHLTCAERGHQGNWIQRHHPLRPCTAAGNLFCILIGKSRPVSILSFWVSDESGRQTEQSCLKKNLSQKARKHQSWRMQSRPKAEPKRPEKNKLWKFRTTNHKNGTSLKNCWKIQFVDFPFYFHFYKFLHP